MLQLQAKMKDFSLEKAAIATLTFFDVLNFAPTLDELWKYLFCKKIDKKKLEEYLENSDFISKKNGFYFLKGKEELIDLRKQKIEYAEKLWKRVNKYSWIFKFMPWIKMTAICNNLAFSNVTGKSDIDLFIITKKRRLFLARSFLTLLFHLLGIRRHGNKIAGRFCLSFWISEDAMNFKNMQIQEGSDYYLAFWIHSLAPVFGNDVYGKFITENEWIFTYFLNTDFARSAAAGAPAKSRISAYLFDFFEGILEKWQMQRANKKRLALPFSDGVVISKNILKFHDRDRRREIGKKVMSL